jgi:hypothetical protein
MFSTGARTRPPDVKQPVEDAQVALQTRQEYYGIGAMKFANTIGSSDGQTLILDSKGPNGRSYFESSKIGLKKGSKYS